MQWHKKLLLSFLFSFEYVFCFISFSSYFISTCNFCLCVQNERWLCLQNELWCVSARLECTSSIRADVTRILSMCTEFFFNIPKPNRLNDHRQLFYCATRYYQLTHALSEIFCTQFIWSVVLDFCEHKKWHRKKQWGKKNTTN